MHMHKMYDVPTHAPIQITLATRLQKLDERTEWVVGRSTKSVDSWAAAPSTESVDFSPS